MLDGEIVALDAAGRPSFALLQQRFGLTKPGDVERVRRSAPVRLFLFDLLELDGAGLADRPYAQRRALLERLVTRGGPIDVPPVVAEATGDDLAPARGRRDGDEPAARARRRRREAQRRPLPCRAPAAATG